MNIETEEFNQGLGDGALKSMEAIVPKREAKLLTKPFGVSSLPADLDTVRK